MLHTVIEMPEFLDRFQTSSKYVTRFLPYLFLRARKIPVQEKQKKRKGKKEESKTDTEKEGEQSAANATPGGKGAGGDANKRKKRKIRLDMHLDQVFLDSQDAFVWLYHPTPWFYWVGGSAIVLGEFWVLGKKLSEKLHATGLFLSPILRQFYNLNFFHGFYFGATQGCTASPDIW